MIHFFHQIRQRLLTENRFSKYILYAVGEIILVVIGILIALQINNWNESNKENEIGLGYLHRIHSDLVKDNSYLGEKELVSQDNQKSFYNYIQSMYLEQSNTDEFRELTSSVYWDAENLILEDKTYVEITNSGKFSFIENEKLRDQIMGYYRRYYAIDEHISEMNQTGIDMFANSYKKIIKFYKVFKPIFNKKSMVNAADWKFINDPSSQEFKDLERTALFYFYKQSVFEKYYIELKAKGSKLIEQIEYEISLGKKIDKELLNK